jgi:hypothetical protein
VKLLRFLLKSVATVAAIGAFLAVVALTPPFQTWVARTELEGQPGLRSSLGSVWAKFGRVDIEDLKLVLGDAVLTVPSASARLPIVDTLLHKRVILGALVAKGWTLDLSHLRDSADERADAAVEEQASAAAKPAQPPAAPAQAAVRAFAGILSGWRLPADMALDGVDLDGDVLIALVDGKAPVLVHVAIKGGGAGAAREGSFTIDAETVEPETGPLADSGSVHGRLVVAMDTPRTVSRAGIDGAVAFRSGPLREDLAVSAGASADRAAGAERYTLDVVRGSRHLASVQADFAGATQRFAGTWKVDFLDSDLAPFIRGRPLPSLVGTGAGNFDADPGLSGLHALGQVSAVVSNLGAVIPAVGDTGRANVAAKFDVVRTGQTLRFSQFLASYSGDNRVLSLRALQPFDIDEASAGVTAQDGGTGWLDVTFSGLPAAWLPPLPGGFAFSEGKASGGFLVSASGGGFTLSPRAAPISISGVSIRGPSGAAVSGLDLQLTMTAQSDAKQLVVSWAPLTVDVAGRRLASLEAKGTRVAGGNDSVAVSGKWTADLRAIASLPSLSALAWLPGSSASGDFTGNLGSACDLEGKVDLAGRDPSRIVSASFNVDVDASGAGDFLVPVKVTLGTSVSDISAEGSWGRQRLDPRVELKLTSADVDLDQLLLLAGPLAAAGGAPSRSLPPSGGGGGAAPWTRDPVPFWGNWAGSVKLSFDRLRTGDQDFTDVGGTFEIDHRSIELEGGHGEVPPKSLAGVEGTITFDPSEARPYALKAALAPMANLDSALLIPAQPGQDPVIEGHFTLAGTVTGTGASLGDLLGRTQEEFQISSTNGIVRLLTTNVADAVPEAAEPIADSLDGVGNFVGSVLLGIKGHSIDPSKNKVSKAAEAMLNFTNQVSEIGFDKVTVTAVRGADRTIRLTGLEMIAPDAHLKGTGQITYAKGMAVSQEPLSLDLRLGVKDVGAKLLSSVGLLSPDKDALGYPLLSQPVHFGGSLVHIDDKEWHDLLAKAAAQKAPDAGKKDKPAGGK